MHGVAMPGPDPAHWLHRFTAREWIRASLGELDAAKRAYDARNARAGLAGARRAAGVALNGLLAATPDAPEGWGRSYMDHLTFLAADADAPQEARDAATRLLQTPLPGGEVVALRTAKRDAAVLDAAETVMAHAYAVVVRAEPVEGESPVT
jgi:HEPN domain-containing protein